jgi:hypothetical protein
MSGPQKKRKKQRIPRGRTISKAGWACLVNLLETVGYLTRGADGTITPHGIFLEEIYRELYPGTAKLTASNFEAAKLRFRRLDPSHKKPIATDDTLKAIRSLKGLNDPSLITSPLTARYFGEIRDKETGRIDELKFCRWLAQSDSRKPIEKNLAHEAIGASGSGRTGKTKQAETSNPPSVKTATTGEHTTELLQVQILVRLPKWEKQWKDQTAALPELRQHSLDQRSRPTGFVNQPFYPEYLTECERLVWGGELVPELPAFELVIANNSDVGFPIDYFGVEIVAAGFRQFEETKKHLPPFLAKCDFVLSIPTVISANGEVAQPLPFVIKHELTAPLFLRPEGVYAFSLRLENSSHEQASAWLIRLLLGIDSTKIQSELIYVQRYQAISQLVKLPRFSAPS